MGYRSDSIAVSRGRGPLSLCDRDTPNRKFQKLQMLPKFPKILNVYFWGDNVYFWRDNVFFGGNNVYLKGNNVYFWVLSKILGFLEFILLLLGGFGDSVGRGGRRGFFENI